MLYSLIFGSIYLLISLGFSLICGVLRIFHLGYGLHFLLTVYLTWMFMKELQLGLIPSITLMVITQLLIAIAMYLGIFRKFVEEEEKLMTLSLLVFLIFENLFNYLYPITAGVNIPVTIMKGVINIGAATISSQMVVAALVGLATTCLLTIFFLRTRTGLIMRAISQNLVASMLMGVNINIVYCLAIILSVIPTIICMLMISPFWGIEPSMGTPLLSIAIVISILGGLGNLKGSIIASFLIGAVHSLVSFTLNPRFMMLAGLLLAIIILTFKSEGLCGAERLW
ncbi:MAG: branched-chain amino acid ABC transporter permease [Candidatus Korarchaeota archaeon]|nr:branched-chain amino acid ABC transporter permease [Thermoproteota archaeon]